MEPANPYDPPLASARPDEQGAVLSLRTITARFVCTPDHLVETLARYRSQHTGRRIWRWVRYFVTLILAVFTIGGLLASEYAAASFLAALTIFMFFSHKVDDFLARRNFRKSPHCDEQLTITLSEDGLYAESAVMKSELKWNAFSKASVFDDGVLLFQGPGMVHWIPDVAFDEEADRAAIRQLLRSKLPNNFVDWQR